MIRRKWVSAEEQEKLAKVMGPALRRYLKGQTGAREYHAEVRAAEQAQGTISHRAYETTEKRQP